MEDAENFYPIVAVVYDREKLVVVQKTGNIKCKLTVQFSWVHTGLVIQVAEEIHQPPEETSDGFHLDMQSAYSTIDAA